MSYHYNLAPGNFGLTESDERALFQTFYRLSPFGVIVRIRNHRPQLEYLYYTPEGGVLRPGEKEALEARDTIINAFLLLVVDCAKKFSRGVITHDEAISRGNLALIDLLEHRSFTNCKYRFSSFLFHHLRGKIWKEVRKNQLYINTFLELPMFPGDDSGLRGERYSIPSLAEPDRVLDAKESAVGRKDFLKQAMKSLSSRERAIMKLRGLKGLKFREAGKKLGMSRQGAQQTFNRACNKLRAVLRNSPDLKENIRYYDTHQ